MVMNIILSKPDLSKMRMLELSDHEFKITVINVLRNLTEKNRQYARTVG